LTFEAKLRTLTFDKLVDVSFWGVGLARLQLPETLRNAHPTTEQLKQLTWRVAENDGGTFTCPVAGAGSAQSTGSEHE
jgi:hypothetical protein